MKALLHVGFYNYVATDSVVALVDCKSASSKRIIKSVREEKPRSIIDVTKGRKAVTLIILTGDRYILSALYRQQLARRMEVDDQIDE